MLKEISILLEYGFRLFPCVPFEKRPAVPGGFKAAVGSVEEFRGLAGDLQRYNVAAATGATSGFTVIDIDPRHGGDGTMRAFTERYGRLPETWTVATPNGGWHIYFHYIQGSKSFAGGHGIDIRSDGGYVVAPPSTIRRGDGSIGSYRWIRAPWDCPLAEAPEWLAREIVQGQKKASGERRSSAGDSEMAALARGVGEGQRNDAAARLAGYLLGKRIDPFITYELLISWNLRNDPPLPEKELEDVIKSIARAEAEKRTRRSVEGGRAS